MAEDIVQYSIGVDFSTAAKKILKIQKSLYNVQNAANKAASSAIRLEQVSFRKESALIMRREKLLDRLNKKRIMTTDEAIKSLTSASGAPRAADTAFASGKLSDYEKSIQAAKNAKYKQDFSNMSAPTGADKADKTALADQIRAEEKRINALDKTLARLKNNQFMLRQNVSEEQKLAQEAIKTNLQYARTAREAQIIYNTEMARYADIVKTNKALDKQGFFMSRLTKSVIELAGTYASIELVKEGLVETVKTGQDLQSINSTMLSVSSSAKEAGDNFKFVKDESYRLGLSLTSSARAFAKLAAARGDISLADTKKLFTGVSEMSTLLGLSADETDRALTAVRQMASKGQIMAEELKQQLGDVMPNALQAMAKAAQDAGLSTSGTVKEMQQLEKQGMLTASKVLPYFAMELHKAAIANGGLEKELHNNRVAMNRMSQEWQLAQNTIFNSGFEKNLTKLFQDMSDFIKNNQGLWKSLGRIIGSVIDGIDKAVTTATPIVHAFGSVLDTVTKQLGDFSGALLLIFVPAILKAVISVKNLTGILTILFDLIKSVGTGAIFSKLVSSLRGMSSSLKIAGDDWASLKEATSEAKEGLADVAEGSGKVGTALEASATKSIGKWLILLDLFKELYDIFEEIENWFTHEKDGLLWNHERGGFTNSKWWKDMTMSPSKMTAEDRERIVKRNSPELWSVLTEKQKEQMFHVEVSIDGEKVGSSITKTNSFHNAVDNKIANTQQ